MARVAPSPPRGMRADEVAELLVFLVADATVAGRRDHALVAFLTVTGARRGSALAHDAEDLDLREEAATESALKCGRVPG